MTSRLVTPLVVALALCGSSAYAAVDSCTGIGDGTACVTECIESGLCSSGVCVATVLRANGTACSTEDRCTQGDTCQSGVCVIGTRVMCPTDGCHIGLCDPAVGCVVSSQCKVDMAQPVPPDMAMMSTDMAMPPIDMSANVNDMSMTQQDLSFYVDLAGTDLGPPGPDMMCYQPPHSLFLICNGPDGGEIVEPLDGGVVDAAVHVPGDAAMHDGMNDSGVDATVLGGHLRGSRPGDCSMTPGARPRPVAAFFVLALLALYGLRRRTA